MSKARKKPKKIRSFSTASLPWYLLAIVVVFFLFFVGVRFKLDSTPAVASSSPEPSMITVEVPSRIVQKGESLDSVPFTSIQWPSNSKANFLQSRNAYKGYFASAVLQPYTPIPLSSLSSTAVDVNVVAGGIPAGYRAITVKVDVESAVEGWAQTGNYVDVILMKQSQDQDLGIEAKVIAENVKILSAGANAEKSRNAAKSVQTPPTVTLLVTQEDALKVRTAATIGKLTFALRGVGDESPTLAVHMSQKNLLGGSKSLKVNNTKTKVKGMAKGPDGVMYILDADSQWIESRDNTEIVAEKEVNQDQ